MVKVSEVAKDGYPFAWVTPDGKWHERAKMGWWGTTSDEKESSAWKKEVDEIAKKYAGYTVVAVDCHI